eukprot:TRINITY_DN38156_c0_g1_i1.p1 TRINITY_DN38156_c0_g1~~TRINITY_DN38156_c0_g1_i1.p1  ORF type:complete len:274 (-),score=6.81 TRINITY_DN38156_c0_g1_i1:152-973(-)
MIWSCIACWSQVWKRPSHCTGVLRSSDNGPEHSNSDLCLYFRSLSYDLLVPDSPTRQTILDYLPSDSRTHLSCTTKAARLEGRTSFGSFTFQRGSTVVSGNDGWLVEFGSFSPLSADTSRLWWALEICELTGLFAIGLADRHMPDNVFLGVPSHGKWLSWGWEVTKKGCVEAVSYSGIPINSSHLRGVNILAPPDSAKRLVMFADFKRATLELFCETDQAGSKRRRFLDRIALDGFGESVSSSMVRPVVCVDIGATLRQLDEAEIVGCCHTHR